MDDCHYCGHLKGGHAKECPGYESNAWRTGYLDGRDGKVSVSNDPEYKLGYIRGEIAGEEAENGHRAWGY